MANPNVQIDKAFYTRKIIAEKATDPVTGEEILWPKGYNKDTDKIKNDSVWFIKDTDKARITQVSFYDGANAIWGTPINIDANSEDIKLENGKDLSAVIGNYINNHSIAELLQPIKNINTSIDNIAGLAPAPKPGDEKKYLTSNSTWSNTNFIGTLADWNNLTLAEKIMYDTADIV